MHYRRMPIEVELPEQLGYDAIQYNLSESSVTDVRLGDLALDLSDLVLAYGDHLGKPELRALLTAETPPLQPDHVLMTVGAASALFIVATSLLKPGDHMIVVYPNYATNIETPRQIGADFEWFQLTFDQRLANRRRRAGGAHSPGDALRQHYRAAQPHRRHDRAGAAWSGWSIWSSSRGCLLLVDETYREMGYAEVLPPAASLSPSVIGVSSLSKTYGLPGLRLGWLMTQNADLMQTFLAAKEQIFISGSVLDEEVAYQYLLHKDAQLARIRGDIARKLGIVREWIAEEPLMEWVEPQGGVACFPRIRPDLGIDVDRFYATLLDDYKTLVGPGHWFECDRHHMRIGFGWTDDDHLRRGLENVSNALRDQSK